MHRHTTDTPFHERHDEELLTLEEVAEILKASEHTLRWWRQQGKGPEFFTMGKRLYTTVGDVRGFIRKQRLAAKPIIGRPKGV
ncbi:MAG: helix-turn-helix domain-containing protein [Nocardioides sp.]|uniref:helix-turn-helix domain-containing protein n=1 Tax=Nocardioides sp. TaxID=35761 RepID=UPI0039E31E61